MNPLLCEGCGGQLGMGAVDDFSAGNLREDPAGKGSAGPAGKAEAGEGGWARLGEYDLYDEIAHGPHGIVYCGRQRRRGELVAVKVLRGGVLAGSEARRQFRREAESAGRLQHPGMVAVHDAGEDHGVCWLTMEFVPGENLAQRVQDRPMGAGAAASCIRKVAEAVHHAHQLGVLHRNLKPSNVLMGLDDQPKLSDFGGTAGEGHLGGSENREAAATLAGQGAGSPGFTAPEQALDGKTTGQSDVYGLGALLYFALTGRAPFAGPTRDSVLLQLRGSDPVPPGRLNPTVPQPLEAICLKCLAKDPRQRYAGAAELAADLKRFEAGQGVSARTVGRCGRAVAWCRRQPALAGMAVSLALAAVGGAAGIFWQWQRAEIKAAKASQLSLAALAGGREARLRTYTAGVQAAGQLLNAEDSGPALTLLTDLIPGPGEEDFRGPEWYVLKHRTRSQDLEVLEGHPWIVACLAASPDGKWLASGGRFVTGWQETQSTAFIWEPATGRRIHDFPPGLGSVKCLQFSRDGSRLMLTSSGKVRFFTAGTWEPMEKEVTGSFSAMAHHHDWLAVTGGAEGEVVIYESLTLTELRRLPFRGSQVLFSGDDQWLAMLDEEGKIRVHPMGESGPETGEVKAFDAGQRMNSLALAPDGRWLVACGGADVQVWDLKAPHAAEPIRLAGHQLDVKSAVFTAGGDRLITTGSDRTIRYWDTETWKPAGILRGHRDEVWCALPDPEGRWLTSGGKDTTVRLWPLEPPGEGGGLPHYVVRPAVWSQDGRHVLLALREGKSRVFDPGLSTGGEVMNVTAEAPGPDESWCRFLSTPGRVEWYDNSGKVLRSVLLEGNPQPFREGIGKAWSGDGGRFAMVLAGLKVGVWDISSGRRVALLPRNAGGMAFPVALSADGRRMAVAGSSAAVVDCYEVDTGRSLRLTGHKARISTLAFSPDAKQLASGSLDATIRLWDTATGEEQAVLRGHLQDVNWVAYAPRGRTLASLGNFEAVRFWNLETATEVASLPQPHASSFLTFSPDGCWLGINQGDPAERPSETLERLLILPAGQYPQSK